MTNDLTYDFEDFGMTVEELEAKYGDKGHPEYTITDWMTQSPDAGDTSGYWNWVKSEIAVDDDAIPGTNEGTTIQITDIETMATIVMNWHQNRIARLRQMMDIPEDAEVHIAGKVIKMTEEVRSAFVIGLIVAISEFRELPFSPSEEPKSTESNDSPEAESNE